MATDDLRDRDWVLLPGTLCTEAVFDGFLDVLGVPSQRRKTIPLRQGTVEAYADSVSKHAEGAILCGFSLGAIVAAHLADRTAARAVILFGLNPNADDPAKAAGRLAMAQDVMAVGGREALNSRLPSFSGADPEKARQVVLAMAETTSADIGAQTDLALSRPGALPALSRTQCPVLALTGSRDEMTPATLGQSAAAAAPAGLFRLLPGLGHYALIEDPDTCAQAVIEMSNAALS